ncbi:MAG: hypothetical protein ACI4BC_05940, partial [Muribaculaceae bacterium]
AAVRSRVLSRPGCRRHARSAEMHIYNRHPGGGGRLSATDCDVTAENGGAQRAATADCALLPIAMSPPRMVARNAPLSMALLPQTVGSLPIAMSPPRMVACNAALSQIVRSLPMTAPRSGCSCP